MVKRIFLGFIIVFLTASTQAATVYGYLRDIGVAALNSPITFTPTNLPSVIGNNLMVGSAKTVVPTNGYFSTTLHTARYNVAVGQWRFVINVPESEDSFNIVTLSTNLTTYLYTNAAGIFKSKVSATDTTSDYLGAKIVGANGITITTNSPSGEAVLVVSGSGSGLVANNNGSATNLNAYSPRLFGNPEFMTSGPFLDTDEDNITAAYNWGFYGSVYFGASVTFAGTVSGDGSGLTGVVKDNNGSATNLSLYGTTTATGIMIDSGGSLLLDFDNSQITALEFSGDFSGNGANLSTLNATQLTSGTVPLARLPSAVLTNNQTGATYQGGVTFEDGGVYAINSIGAIDTINGINSIDGIGSINSINSINTITAIGTISSINRIGPGALAITNGSVVHLFSLNGSETRTNYATGNFQHFGTNGSLTISNKNTATSFLISSNGEGSLIVGGANKFSWATNGDLTATNGTLSLSNLVTRGLISTTAAAPTIASASTITPTKAITFISGVATVSTITAPSPISAGGGQITFIPTGTFSTDTSGNIALSSIATVNRALIMTYDVATAKWYPSY